MYRLLYVLAYCIVYLSCYRLLYVITCKLCSEYLYRVYVILCLLCYAMVGCCAVPCPKNFSAQSDPVSFCASDNKRLVTCKKNKREREFSQGRGRQKTATHTIQNIMIL